MMKRMAAIMFLLVFLFSLCGCHGEELERFFIVTAMAIDWEEDGYVLRLEGSADEVDENKNPKAILREGRGSNLTQCFLDVQKQTGEYPYTRQTELILLSSAMPPRQMTHLLDDLLNENGVRLNARVAVTDGKAADLLEEGSFSSQRILKAVTKGGGTLTSADIMLRDLAYTRTAAGIDPILPITCTDHTEGLCLLKEDGASGQITSALTPIFMMAGGTERGGSVTVEVGGKAQAFKLLHNRSRICTDWENGQAVVKVVIDAEFRAADLLERELELYEAALQGRLERDLQELVELLKTAGCDALGFGQSLSRRHPILWKQIKGAWPTHFAACRILPEISVTITSTGKLKSGEEGA